MQPRSLSLPSVTFTDSMTIGPPAIDIGPRTRIVILMSSAFTASRPSHIRAIGIAVALLLLVLLAVVPSALLSGGSILLPGVTIGVVESGAGGAPMDRAFVAAALLVASLFSWLLAEMAVRPGWRAAMSAVFAFAAGAVVLGSFVVAGLESFAAGGDVATVVGSTIALGLLGVVFVGVPMLVIGVALAAVWVVIVRAVVRLVT
jgi:hypothetical protein